MDIDIVELKEYVKRKNLSFFIKDGYIYCEDLRRGERVILGNYSCVELSNKVLKIVLQNGLHQFELIDDTRTLKVKKFADYSFLTSLGFELRKKDNHYVKKVYLNNDNDDRNFYDINPQTRELKVDIQSYLDNTLLSLCKGGILE